MKLYYMSLEFAPDALPYVARLYHLVDWEFTGRIKYTNELKDSEVQIHFEVVPIRQTWLERNISCLFAQKPNWVSESIFFYEENPYEQFIPRETIVVCETP